MRAKLLALVLVASIPGCSVTFGYIGNRSGHSANAEARAKGKPETASPGTRTMVGFLFGLIVDVAIVASVADGAAGGLSR